VVVGRGKGAEVQARVGGDEPVLLAQRIRRMPVVVDANRASAGQWAERELSPDVFLLDDGFQHLALERDRNVVLLSPSDPLGGGALPPAGLLREPAEALARATHGVVLCSPGEDPSRALDALHRFAPAAVATVAVRRTIGPFTPSGDPVDRAPLAPLRLLAVTGTAKPDGAFRAMRDLGLRIEETLPFSDHHRYGPDDFARIGRILDEKQLDGVVTTGKDAVKFGAEVGFPWWWIDVAVDGDWSGILDVLDEWEVRA
jgi:tetraacyldisaccharide 4'-kinase